MKPPPLEQFYFSYIIQHLGPLSAYFISQEEKFTAYENPGRIVSRMIFMLPHQKILVLTVQLSVLLTDSVPEVLEYVFQATLNNATLLRFDSVPHHKNIATFPHHKHIGSSERVEPLDDPSFRTFINQVALRCHLGDESL